MSMEEYEYEIRVKVDRESFYDLWRNKEIPPDLSYKDIEWEIVPCKNDILTFILYAKALKNQASS